MPDHWVVWFQDDGHSHEVVYRGSVMECLAYMAGVDTEARRHGVALERDGSEIRASGTDGAALSWVIAPEHTPGSGLPPEFPDLTDTHTFRPHPPNP